MFEVLELNILFSELYVFEFSWSWLHQQSVILIVLDIGVPMRSPQNVYFYSVITPKCIETFLRSFANFKFLSDSGVPFVTEKDV